MVVYLWYINDWIREIIYYLFVRIIVNVVYFEYNFYNNKYNYRLWLYDLVIYGCV